jgi:hypothetical protein
MNVEAPWINTDVWEKEEERKLRILALTYRGFI